MIDESFSRDDVAAWAGLTRPQLNHFHKIGLCVSDVGDVRKRISRQEAVLSAGVAAFVRQGVQAKNLVGPFNWLREQLATDTKVKRGWSVAVNGLPTDAFAHMTADPDRQARLWETALKDFWFSVYADENEWKTQVGRSPTVIEGKEGFVMVNFRTVVANRGDLGGRE